MYQNPNLVKKLFGCKKGIIYIPQTLVFREQSYTPGVCIRDAIRQQYAHAWYFLKPNFFDDTWFHDTFGGAYHEKKTTPKKLWTSDLETNPIHIEGLKRCRNKTAIKAYKRKDFRSRFITNCAATSFADDFAQTFMWFLKYRRSLTKFESRSVVYKKLQAVDRAAGRQARHLK